MCRPAFPAFLPPTTFKAIRFTCLCCIAPERNIRRSWNDDRPLALRLLASYGIRFTRGKAKILSMDDPASPRFLVKQRWNGSFDEEIAFVTGKFSFLKRFNGSLDRWSTDLWIFYKFLDILNVWKYYFFFSFFNIHERKK